jgi:hypothetical protein
MKRSIGIALLMSIAFLGKAQDAPKPPSVEDRLKHTKEVIEKDLQLTPAQENQLIQAYTDFFNQMEKLHKDAPPPPPPPPPPPMDPKMKEQFDKLVKERDEKMKQVLSEDQYKKYLEAVKKLHSRHSGGKGENTPPPPPPPPSSE